MSHPGESFCFTLRTIEPQSNIP